MNAVPGVPLGTSVAGRGVAWGLASEDLNVNLVGWPEGDGVGEHVNDAVDVLFVVVAGRMRVALDGAVHDVGEGQVIVVPRGVSRSVTAGPGGVRYLSCHRRRPPLSVT